MIRRKVISGTIIGLISFLLITGCAHQSKKELESSPQGLYENGMNLFQKKKYQKAADAFKKFKEEYPLSEYTPQVELRTADSLYLDKKYAEAIQLYEEFKKLHPLHAEIPYVIYQLGMCHFKRIPNPEREQTETEKSIEQFRYLTENFPQSPYAAQAQAKLQICQRHMLEHEFGIGYFYYRTKKYKAALGRFEGIRQKYPGSTMEKQLNNLIEKCQIQVRKEENHQKELDRKKERKKVTFQNRRYPFWTQGNQRSSNIFSKA